MLNEMTIRCPYCGETLAILVDSSGGSQQYYEDCQVCCRPMLLNIVIDDGSDQIEPGQIEVRRDDD